MKPSLHMFAAFAVLAVFLLAGCGGAPADKAGGTHHATTVLTLANSLGDENELQAFADEVERRSEGSLRIRFSNDWRKDQRDYEPALIRDVAAGKADLCWVGSRAFPAVGIHSFDALTAPPVIDRYELEGAVLGSHLPDAMLRSLAPLGVTGLGVLPGPAALPARRAAAAASPGGLRRPACRLPARTGRDTLRALGATPVTIPPPVDWQRIDAIEQQVQSINGNSYNRRPST